MNLTCVLSSAMYESVTAGPSNLAYSSLFKLTCVSEFESVDTTRSNFSLVRAYKPESGIAHHIE